MMFTHLPTIYLLHKFGASTPFSFVFVMEKIVPNAASIEDEKFVGVEAF